MRAYLIDPATKTVTDVGFDGKPETVYSLVGCRTFEIVRMGADDVYVDEESMVHGKPTAFFFFEGAPSPLAGRGLVLSHDRCGDWTEPRISLADITANVRFMSFDEVHRWAEVNR